MLTEEGAGEVNRFVVMSQRLAGFLMLRGFVLQGIGDNRRHVGRNVFFFNDSPELRMAMADYKQMSSGGKANDEAVRAGRGLYESS